MEFRKNVIHGYTLNMFPNIPFKFEKKPKLVRIFWIGIHVQHMKKNIVNYSFRQWTN